MNNNQANNSHRFRRVSNTRHVALEDPPSCKHRSQLSARADPKLKTNANPEIQTHRDSRMKEGEVAWQHGPQTHEDPTMLDYQWR